MAEDENGFATIDGRFGIGELSLEIISDALSGKAHRVKGEITRDQTAPARCPEFDG